MTEITTTSATAVTNDQALVPAPAQLPAMAIQEVDQIVAIRPDFLDDANDLKLKEKAKTMVDAILANPTDANVTVQVYSLGSDDMNANTESISLMETKISSVMKEIEIGSPVNKSLTQIKTELDLINPSVVAQTESSLPTKALFGLITRMVSRLPKGNEILLLINERKDTVSTTINSLKRHLWTERDKALFNATELANISNQLFETQQDLQETVYIGQIIWASLNQAKESETDPVKQQALANLVNDLAIQVVDIQTVDSLNVQSRMSAETLINNSRKIQQGVARVTNVLLPAVATNLMVKAAAAQQAQLVNSMNDITRAAEQTILDTAKQTRQATVAMEKMQSVGLINPEILQSVADEAVAMINGLESIRAETELKARQTSKALGEVSSVMRKYADPMTKARHAMDMDK